MQTHALLLRHGPEAITRPVASFEKNEIKNIGRHQRGGTSAIIWDQLAGFVLDSGVDPTGSGKHLKKIVPPKARKLNAKVKKICPG